MTSELFMLELHIIVNEFLGIITHIFVYSNIAPTITVAITFLYITVIKITIHRILHGIAYSFHSNIVFFNCILQATISY